VKATLRNFKFLKVAFTASGRLDTHVSGR